MTSIASRAIRQAVLPVALLGLFACGCACFGHHGVQAAPPGGGHSPQHVATRGTIPPEFLDLVTTKKAFANLATVMPNGSPQVTPVWFDFDGKYLRVNSARGRVIKITEDGAVEHTDLLARKYLGAERNPSRRPDQVRVMYIIEPRRVAGQ